MDDVRIEDGACSKSVCDFEDENICGYTNDAAANFKWLRKNGINSLNTPTIDHTFGTSLGNYMSIE